MAKGIVSGRSSAAKGGAATKAAQASAAAVPGKGGKPFGPAVATATKVTRKK